MGFVDYGRDLELRLRQSHPVDRGAAARERRRHAVGEGAVQVRRLGDRIERDEDGEI